MLPLLGVYRTSLLQQQDQAQRLLAEAYSYRLRLSFPAWLVFLEAVQVPWRPSADSPAGIGRIVLFAYFLHPH